MSSAIRGPADFWAGLIYIAFGVIAIVVAQDYGMGTATRMGPGYFPTVLGCLLTLVGIIGLVRGLRVPGEAVGKPSLRSICLIAGPIILFALLLRGAGLVIAMPVLIMGSAYASRYFNILHAALLTIGLTAFCSFVFVKALGIPLPLVGTWFGN